MDDILTTLQHSQDRADVRQTLWSDRRPSWLNSSAEQAYVKNQCCIENVFRTGSGALLYRHWRFEGVINKAIVLKKGEFGYQAGAAYTAPPW